MWYHTRKLKRKVPLYPQLAEEAGLIPSVAAAAVGLKPAMYSLIKSRRRTWQGLTPEQEKLLEEELIRRAEGISALLSALDAGELGRRRG